MGRRIRAAREAKGWSQEQLALAISRDQSAVSAYEAGSRKIAAVDLPRLAETLDVSILYFYSDALTRHDRDEQLLEQFHTLPTEQAQQAAITLSSTEYAKLCLY